jgi:hypothetical protein
MMSTDGVGTKLELARSAGRWEGVGRDLVAMCVDDLAAVGARPLGFVDYMAVGALDGERDAAIVASIARACAEAACALVGGETAEHPGVMEPDAVDLITVMATLIDFARLPATGAVAAGAGALRRPVGALVLRDEPLVAAPESGRCAPGNGRHRPVVAGFVGTRTDIARPSRPSTPPGPNRS